MTACLSVTVLLAALAGPEAAPAGRAVLVAYEGSPQAARALAAFEATGLGRDRDLHAVWVGANEPAPPPVERAVAFLHAHDLPAVAQVVTRDRPPAEVLLHLAGQIQAGLIVMGAFGHSHLREFLFGSVTRQVLKRTTIPVFLYH